MDLGSVNVLDTTPPSFLSYFHLDPTRQGGNEKKTLFYLPSARARGQPGGKHVASPNRCARGLGARQSLGSSSAVVGVVLVGCAMGVPMESERKERTIFLTTVNGG